jgi:hypothetical protein
VGLQPGDLINRAEFAKEYNANNSRGITRSGADDVVNVFYGADSLYPDRWEKADVLLRYTGDGRRGDQELKYGNGLLQEVLESQNVIRLFQFARPRVWLFRTWARVVGVELGRAPDENGDDRQVFEWLISPCQNEHAEPASEGWQRARSEGLAMLARLRS